MAFNLSGHASQPTKMTFSPDGTRLLSVDSDGKMMLWDLANQKLIATAHEFSGNLHGVVTCLNGNVAAWMQNTIWLFNPQTRDLKSPTYIPGRNILAVSPSCDLAAGYTPLKVSLYDALTGELKQTLPEEAEDVYVEYYLNGDIIRQFYGALFSLDGNHLATFGTGGVWMYTLPDGSRVSHWKGNNTRKAVFSADGAWLVASNSENWAPPYLIDFKNSKEIFSLGIPSESSSSASGLDYFGYAFSPDKRWIGMLRHGWEEPVRLELVDTSTGLLSKWLDFEDNDLLSLAFNPSGTLIAIGLENGEITLVDTISFEIVSSFEAHPGAVTSLTFSQDGRMLVSTEEDGAVKIWGIP